MGPDDGSGRDCRDRRGPPTHLTWLVDDGQSGCAPARHGDTRSRSTPAARPAEADPRTTRLTGLRRWLDRLAQLGPSCSTSEATGHQRPARNLRWGRGAGRSPGCSRSGPPMPAVGGSVLLTDVPLSGTRSHASAGTMVGHGTRHPGWCFARPPVPGMVNDPGRGDSQPTGQLAIDSTTVGTSDQGAAFRLRRSLVRPAPFAATRAAKPAPPLGWCTIARRSLLLLAFLDLETSDSLDRRRPSATRRSSRAGPLTQVIQDRLPQRGSSSALGHRARRGGGRSIVYCARAAADPRPGDDRVVRADRADGRCGRGKPTDGVDSAGTGVVDPLSSVTQGTPARSVGSARLGG